MSAKPITIVTGQPTALPLQFWLRGTGGTRAALFNATDALSAAVIQTRQTTPVFTPSVLWYTAASTQSGYGQGQVEVSLSTASMLLLIPSVSYTLDVWRSLAGDPSDLELIARVPLVIEPLAG